MLFYFQISLQEKESAERVKFSAADSRASGSQLGEPTTDFECEDVSASGAAEVELAGTKDGDVHEHTMGFHDNAEGNGKDEFQVEAFLQELIGTCVEQWY